MDAALDRAPAAAPAPRARRLPRLPPLRRLAAGFRDLPGLVVLEGGADVRGEGRWSYLSADPFDTLRWTAAGVESERQGALPGDGFQALRQLSARRSAVQNAAAQNAAVPSARAPGARPPFAGGAIGYLAYDAAYTLESLPGRCPEPLAVDLMWAGLYDWVVARDARGGGWLLASADGGRDPDALCARAGARLTALAPPPAPAAARRAWSRTDARRFRRGVAAVKDYIAAGDCYQVNLARRIEFDAPDPGLDDFQRLAAAHGAPFGAYLAAGSLEVVSASPELFLRVTPDGRARTRPIKGTAPRGATAAADADAAAGLRASAKDRAENVMIVDVLRNDFGRVCRPGSICVPRLWETEALPTVWQLVSEVRGELAAGAAAADLLRACWPGGSITGAPKIRASEIIDELEPVRRGVYCGSVFALGFDGGLTASLAIRTVQRQGGVGHLHVGAGIVAESDAAQEYAETEHKARGVLQALGAAEASAAATGASAPQRRST